MCPLSFRTGRLTNAGPAQAVTLVGKDIELDAVNRQFEPYLTAGCVWHAGGALVV